MTSISRLQEIEIELYRLREIFRKAKSAEAKVALNNLMWLLIREKHRLSYDIE